MWKALLGLFLALPAYSQVFTEDIAKINHFLAEEELEIHLKDPDSKGIPGEFLKSLGPTDYIDPYSNCDESPYSYKPKRIRYEVIAAMEEGPVAPSIDPRMTVAVVRYRLENPLITKVKDLLSSQSENPGTVNLNYTTDNGGSLIKYVAPGTSVDVQSNIRTENAFDLDLNTKKSLAPSTTMKVDLANKVDIKQSLTDASSVKVGLEALYSTGARGLDSLDGMKLQISEVKAGARFDSKLERNIDAHTAINYAGNTYDRSVNVVAGLNIRVPDGAEILVFTGHTTKQALQTNAVTGKENSKEVGVEYKKKNGVKIYGRYRDGNRGEKIFETGVKIDLNK